MVVAAQDSPIQRRSVALTISVALHALILLFFLLYKIITPIPPFPDDEGSGGGAGLELSLGTTEFGMGDNSASETPSAASAPAPTPTPEETHDEPLLTGADDNSVVVKDEPKPKTPVKEKAPKPKEPVKPKEPTVSKGLSNALNAWNTPGTGSSGKGSSTTPGTAGGPTGTANGTGIGTGTGAYIGRGYTIDFDGTIRKKPVINEKPSVGGKVVVDIWVDPDGKVVRVSQNTSKSTTLDQTLYAIAKRAALESTFYPNPKATGEQKGSISFTFILE